MTITTMQANTQRNTLTHADIDQLARKAAAGTLKRIYTASGTDMIRKLQQSLQADFSRLDNAEYNTTINVVGQTVSDAYDIYMVAYEYLHEQIIVNGLTPESEISVTLKNGTDKTRTVFQWACVAVRKYIYANKSIENNGKYVYIEDLAQNEDIDGITALDREYIRMGKYNGINTYEDHINYKDIRLSLKLTDRQDDIVTMRMRGMSVTQIANKLDVTKGAISKQLTAIQEKLATIHPELIRAFNLDKWTR